MTSVFEWHPGKQVYYGSDSDIDWHGMQIGEFPVDLQNLYLGIASVVSALAYVGLVLCEMRKQVLAGAIGNLILGWTTISVIFNVVSLIQWAIPGGRRCVTYSITHVFALFAAPLYFLSLAVLLFRGARNPFKADRAWPYHLAAIAAAALATYVFSVETHLLSQDDPGVVPEGQPCPHVFLLHYHENGLDFAIYLLGMLVTCFSLCYLRRALSSQSTVFTRYKRVALKGLLIMLAIEAFQQISTTCVIALLRHLDRYPACVTFECIMQGISTAVPCLSWLAIYFALRPDKARQESNGEFSVGLRRQLMELLASAICESANSVAKSAAKSPLVPVAYTLGVETVVDDVKVVARAPEVFHDIRSIFNISTDDYVKAIQAPAKENFTEGKSGAFLYFTGNRRFIIKTATAEEFKLFFSMLPDYHRHIQENPKSLINPMIGAYELHLYSNHLRVIVVESCFYHADFPIHERFDLKGSWIGRKAKHQGLPWINKGFAKEGVFKDLDVPGPFYFEPKLAAEVGRVLRADSDFLAKHGVMDYSLLVGVSKTTFSVDLSGLSKKAPTKLNMAPMAAIEGPSQCAFGIIDILQKYNCRKTFEYYFLTKILCKGPGVSCVPPDMYANRFQDNIVRALIESAPFAEAFERENLKMATGKQVKAMVIGGPEALARHAEAQSRGNQIKSTDSQDELDEELDESRPLC